MCTKASKKKGGGVTRKEKRGKGGFILPLFYFADHQRDAFFRVTNRQSKTNLKEMQE